MVGAMVAQAVFSTGLLTSYCRAEDVLALLVGYDLSRLGDEEAIGQRLEVLLPATRQAVDALAGHDFLWHADETVVLDGNGRDRLSLLEAGTAPIVAVHEVAIAGQVVPSKDYVVYGQRAEIRLRPDAPTSRFPEGLQNVAVTLDWGYPQVPEEVALAQAKLTAAQLLAEAAGEKAGAAEVRLGDWAVRYAPEGKYGAVIAGFAREAEATLRRYRRLSLRVV